VRSTCYLNNVCFLHVFLIILIKKGKSTRIPLKLLFNCQQGRRYPWPSRPPKKKIYFTIKFFIFFLVLAPPIFFFNLIGPPKSQILAPPLIDNVPSKLSIVSMFRFKLPKYVMQCPPKTNKRTKNDHKFFSIK
jgi:hypothetical protein